MIKTVTLSLQTVIELEYHCKQKDLKAEKPIVSIQSHAPGRRFRGRKTRATSIERKKHRTLDLGLCPPFTVAPTQQQTPLPFRSSQDSESAQPWGHSHAGAQPRPCGRRPASSSCGEPMARSHCQPSPSVLPIVSPPAHTSFRWWRHS